MTGKPRLLTTSEYRFWRTDAGCVTDGTYPYAYWARLLPHVAEVTVVARIADGTPPGSARRVDGPGVRLVLLDGFRGPTQLVGAMPQVLRTLAQEVARHDAFLLRCPGILATLVYPLLRARRRPFAAELVGDPWESLRDLGPIAAALRPLVRAMTRTIVGHATAVRYVTARTLQQRYPAAPGAFQVASSDVEIDDALLVAPLPETRPGPTLSIAFVGALDRAYKGLDVLLAALARTREPHRLTVIGDGVLRVGLEASARPLGDRVRFLGMLPGSAAVQREVATHDLFVLPSRTEGLPRALVEAMALGLPCLATPVGGTPELLDDDQLVAVDDAPELAARIDELASDAGKRARLGSINRGTAGRFARSERDRKMGAFFTTIAMTASR